MDNQNELQKEITDQTPLPDDTNPNKLTVKSLHIIPTTLSLLLMALLVGVAIFTVRHVQDENSIVSTIKPITIGTHFDQFLGLSLQAKAVYVYDVNDRKILFAKNEEAQLPLASLTKVMTALVIAESVPESTIVTIPQSSVEKDKKSGVASGIQGGDRLKLHDLIGYTLSVSSNGGAGIIAALGSGIQLKDNGSSTTTPFLEQMNTVAKELSLHQTYFLNETGLDISETKAGAYGSAKDVATLFEYILIRHPSIVEPTSYKDASVGTINNNLRKAVNTNAIISETPRVLASKTGLTPLAGGNLAMVVDAGLAHPIIIVVLGSTEQGRFDDVKKLIKTATETLNLKP